MSDESFEDQKNKGKNIFPCQAGSLKKGEHLLINGKPCKLVEMTTSKTGKHGHAKANITGIDIFTGRKYEDSVPTSHNIECPVVSKKEYALVSIEDDGFCSLQDEEDGSLREDIKLPKPTDVDFVEKLLSDIKAKKHLIVTVTSAMNEEHITSYREDKK